MRVLHEIDCPYHRVAVRFSREEFYLCNHHSSRGMYSFQGMLWVLIIDEIMKVAVARY